MSDDVHAVRVPSSEWTSRLNFREELGEKQINPRTHPGMVNMPVVMTVVYQSTATARLYMNSQNICQKTPLTHWTWDVGYIIQSLIRISNPYLWPLCPKLVVYLHFPYRRVSSPAPMSLF